MIYYAFYQVGRIEYGSSAFGLISVNCCITQKVARQKNDKKYIVIGYM